jgi:chorismate mutase
MQDTMNELYALRAQQDAIDLQILEAVGLRVAIRDKISAYRIAHGLPTIDPARIEFVLDNAEKNAENYGVPKEMARQLFDLLIGWSHHLHRQWRSEQMAEKIND